ncbi:MAG: 2-hydroxymuconate tautomerase, partial [Candidatus Eisenbacteria bacterium]|nr:2-hydroxymuconate tautomerase [Candidatus Eisenbacteria bacterium]
MHEHREGGMPLVEISMLTGRDADTKEEMIKEVTDAVVRTSGAPPEAVTVIIREVERTDWARGGVAYS